MKSPSVPNFHDRVYPGHSSSDPALVNDDAILSDHRTVEPSCLGQASPSEHDRKLELLLICRR